MIRYAGYTKEEWFSLPLKLRQQYWRETDYGRTAPSVELAKTIVALLKAQESATVK
jgi:hypothetical protein